jgi:hypothetical protein
LVIWRKPVIRGSAVSALLIFTLAPVTIATLAAKTICAILDQRLWRTGRLASEITPGVGAAKGGTKGSLVIPLLNGSDETPSLTVFVLDVFSGRIKLSENFAKFGDLLIDTVIGNVHCTPD